MTFWIDAPCVNIYVIRVRSILTHTPHSPALQLHCPFLTCHTVACNLRNAVASAVQPENGIVSVCVAVAVSRNGCVKLQSEQYQHSITLCIP
jgi:hypothetical protein